MQNTTSYRTLAQAKAQYNKDARNGVALSLKGEHPAIRAIFQHKEFVLAVVRWETCSDYCIRRVMFGNTTVKVTIYS